MNLELVKYLPKDYYDSLKKAVRKIISIFDNDIVCIILGGSGGKNEIIEGYSDLDLYIILETIDIKKIGKMLIAIEKYPIHIGITYYSKSEFINKRIDNKTKIMLYEKRFYNVNPTIYGNIECPYIAYQDVLDNDINNFPNIKHVLIRECAYCLTDNSLINKKIAKKLFVLIKCYLNMNGIFSYGYERSLKRFLAICPSIDFNYNIVDMLKNIDKYKKKMLDFSLKVLDYINDEERKNYMEKRISSRGIIIEDGKVLTIFRRKKKDDGSFKEYYVIPGGGLEEGETLEENVTRELNEEFGVDIKINGFVGKLETEKTIEYYFDCKIVNGTPEIGGEEKDRMSEDNYYEVRKIDLDKIQEYDLQGIELIRKAESHEYTEL